MIFKQMHLPKILSFSSMEWMALNTKFTKFLKKFKNFTNQNYLTTQLPREYKH